jgi:hypothetical protein
MVGFSEWARGGDRWRQCRRGGSAGEQIQREKGKKGEVGGEEKIKEIKRKEKKKRALWTFDHFYLPLAKKYLFTRS